MTVFKKIFFLFLFAATLSACAFFENNKGTENSSNSNDSTHIVRKYYPNKKLKAEISVKDTMRHGLSKTYSQAGILVSEVMYLNGKRNGKAISYYPEGSVNSEVFYKDNIKTGESRWYYTSGKIYRVTSYKQGQIDGLQKMYYENGVVKAEIPYSGGKKCPGLKEFKEDGKPRLVPEILFEELDRMALNNSFTLKIRLSNHTRTVKYFLGNSQYGTCLSGFETSLPVRDGIGYYEVDIPRGVTMMKKLDIIVVEQTSFGNERILHRIYNLAIKNR